MMGRILVFFVGVFFSNVVFAQGLIPLPVKVEMRAGQDFVIDQNTVIVATKVDELGVGEYLNQYMALPMPLKTTAGASNYIKFSIEQSFMLPAEGYTLDVNSSRIEIRASDRAGLFYGLQTMLQLMPAEVFWGAYSSPITVLGTRIEDYPRFAYRGMHLDVARTFVSKERVMRFIDHLSHHKINKFHWHLTDDEGWRIEIKSYPQLATRGGFRGGDSPVKPIYGEWDRKYGGYYTQQEIREVVQYAQFRNIEIIPEIDLPGHSRTVARIFPEILCGGVVDSTASGFDARNVWCVARAENYVMLEKILTEICGLFPSKTIHIGGDEVQRSQWAKCPNCAKLLSKQKGAPSPQDQLTDIFIAKLDAILLKNGKQTAVWNEATRSGKLPKRTTVYGWESVPKCVSAVRSGYNVVVMPGHYFYFDHKQSPPETGLTWAGIVSLKRCYDFEFSQMGFTDKDMDRVNGVEGAFWSELYVSQPENYLDYQTYPRICALAELGWSTKESRRWVDFQERLTYSHFDRLTAMGLNYSLMPPEVNYQRGIITAVAPFAGVQVRYTFDGSEPDNASRLYTTPIKDSIPNNYLFKSFYKDHPSQSIYPTAKYKVTVGAWATQTVEVDISNMVSVNGLWCLRIRSSQLGLKFNNLVLKYGGKSDIIVQKTTPLNEAHLMRIYINKENRAGKLSVSIINPCAIASDIAFELELSPYIEPAVVVTTSMTINSRFPAKNAGDYNFSTYTRTLGTCRPNDYFQYTFASPLVCKSIDVQTGLSYLPRYHFVSGYVAVSFDGVAFERVVDLKSGCATITPAKPIKALRVVSAVGGNGENAVAIQDLKICPKEAYPIYYPQQAVDILPKGVDLK